MNGENIEKPALVEEMGLMEGLKVTKGPRLLPPPEVFERECEDEE